MRRIFTVFGAIAALGVFAALISTDAASQAINRFVAQGAGYAVGSGGYIDVESGGQLRIAGTDRTSALSTAPAAVASGYVVARGETALDGSNPTPVTTGLSTITGCSLTIKSTAAPGVSTSVVTYGSATGTMNMYGWKVTGTGDATLIASTGTDTVGWVCLGT